jgi:hypothetical protein
MSGKAKNLEGMVFCRLTVLCRAENIGNSTAWTCKCQCGGIKIARSSMLVGGRTRSCGCLNSELSRSRRTTHGKSKTVEYKSYFQAYERCSNKNRKDYPRYGGRGIEFRFTSFEQFLSELGPRPEGCSLDRIDNNVHYEPGNVRWASPVEQANNKRNSAHATCNGVTKTVAEWFGSSSNEAARCYKRIHKGWSASDAVSYELQNLEFTR